jgi:hypothetical protein
VLTEQETNDMHAMVAEMEDRGCAGDLYTLSRLAETTGDAWDKLVRECLEQWKTPLITLKPDESINWECDRCKSLTSTMLTRCYVCGTPRPADQPTLPQEQS